MRFQLVGSSALVCLAVIAAGCGSSSKSSSGTTATTATSKKPAPITVSTTPAGPVPKAKEPLSGFEKRLTAAAHAAAAGNCAATTAFGKTSQFNMPCKGPQHKAFAGFKVTGGATYGAGAVVEYTDAEVASKTHVVGFPGVSPTTSRNTGVYPLAVSTSGRYVYQPAGSGPVFPGSYIGTKPTGWAGADAEAVKFLTAVRDNNCDTWFKNVITPNGMAKKTACQLGLIKSYGPLRQELIAQPVKLNREDGNGVFYFYRLDTGKTTGTLGIARDQPPAPAFIAMGATPAAK
jgi:hypothetical protein